MCERKRKDRATGSPFCVLLLPLLLSVTVGSSQKREGRIKQGRETLDTILFPSENAWRNSRNALPLSRVPACLDSTYCEETPYYPSQLVFEMLRRNVALRNYAVTDQFDVSVRTNVDDEQPLCISNEQLISPKTAETVNGAWLFVAQLKEQNFTQSLRIETCIEEGNPCRVIDGLLSGYETRCKQKYVYRQLAAISPNGNIKPEYFRFPSSCCCTASLNVDRRRSIFSK